MFESLIAEKHQFSFLVLEDGVEVDGQTLLSTILKQQSTASEIHILALQNSPRQYQDTKYKIYDFYSNPHHWDDEVNNSHILDQNFDLKNIIPVTSNSKNDIICIDSLSHLMINLGATNTYKQLNFLKNNFKKVISLLHYEEVTSQEILNIKYLSDLYVVLKERKVEDKVLVHLTWRKPGGKVVNQDELVQTGADVVKSKVYVEEKVNVIVETKPDMSSLTTFRLDLEESEKSAKNKLILPYLRQTTDEDEEEDVRTLQPGGKIIYEPDEADDFDEEDPDDDLDV